VFVPSPSPSLSPLATRAASSGTGYLDRSPLNVKASRPKLSSDASQPNMPPATLRSTDTIVNRATTQALASTGTGVARQSSLRSMISLPNLRKNRSRDDDAVGVYDRDGNERRSERPKEMVQVKDTEFELVRPNLPLLQSQRTSEDSIIGRPDNSAEFRVDGGGLLRSESPVASLNSDYRSPVIETPNSTNGSGLNLDAGIPPLGQSNESIEAHRQREIKWVSLMSSSPASLSRKSKKVKKLLVDGVPSSVRYLIWSYLTNGKGRAVKGVYEQLCQRGGVIRTRDIVADAERLFSNGSEGMQYLRATKGAVIVLLQAYFSMVPDVQYTTGNFYLLHKLLDEQLFRSDQDSWATPTFGAGGRRILDIYLNHGHSHPTVLYCPLFYTFIDIHSNSSVYPDGSRRSFILPCPRGY